MLQPNKYVVEGFDPIMPDMSRTLSPAQIWSIVAFLQSSGGEVTVSGQDIGSGGTVAPTTTPAPATTAATDPQEIMRASQCLLCHKVGAEGGAIGPDLSTIGSRRDASYLRRSILDPDREIAPGFEALKGVMPKNYGQQLTGGQLEAVVDYLVGLK
jgi:mono/diheme cytochrome c family protein